MWEYIQPVRIIFGNGAIKGLANILSDMNLDKGVIVTDSFFAENGIADEMAAKTEGVINGIFSEIEENPTTKNVDNCAVFLREKNAQFVVALGGGSALDCAKAACTTALTGEPIAKYHGTGIPLPKKHLPLIAVPTTSGTGTEVTSVSVLTNRELGKKLPLASDNFYPDLAIVDPELTYTVPPKITAITGMDVLAHALEGFWSKKHQPICDALAVHAAKLVFEYLPSAYSNQRDIIAKEKMSEASLMAGLAFSLPKTTASHACSFPLTNDYNIPHGQACALTLDYFTKVNSEVERVKDLAKMLGFKDACEMADKVAGLRRELGLDVNNLSLSKEQIDELVTTSIQHPNMLNSPVEVTRGMLEDLFNRLFSKNERG